MMTTAQKYKTVIDKNTFYFYNPVFQEKYESYINSLNETLLVLKNQVDTQGLKKELFENLLAEKENGLRALLALTGFANESLKRLITVVRVAENQELAKLLLKDKWVNWKIEGVNARIIKEREKLSKSRKQEARDKYLKNIKRWELEIEDLKSEEISEWSDNTIETLTKKNEFFRKGLVNLFFEGSTVPFLAQTLPLFELKKLSISKLNFEIPAMIDTLVRYKEKGSYAGQAENNPELLIKTILEDLKIPFEKGDLEELFKNEQVAKRTMDFILPNKTNPKIIIESTFLMTTSSGQGDKSKTEGNIKKLIEQYYPKAKFIGFVDGIGWYVRQGDLKRMVTAFDEVFTFHKDELDRFKNYLKQNLK